MSSFDGRWMRERLAGHAKALGAELPEPAGAYDQLATYAGELVRWNERINLTGARDVPELVDDHLADALPLLAHLPAGAGALVDVGSGAGLPGVVLAVLRPDLDVTLLEPVTKKRHFLAHVIRRLVLARARALPERLEDHLEASGAGAYDVAVARAVWPPAEWLERARPLLRRGGRILGSVAASDLGNLDVQVAPYTLGARDRAVVRVDV